MSDANKKSLIDEQFDYVQTDIITDLKSGIYNLFISLLNNYIVNYGPEKGMDLSVQYLEEIIEHFKSAVSTNEQEK